MLPPGAILELKIHENAYAAALGKLTELLRPPSWLSGSRFAACEERGREGREGGKGRGSVPNIFFFTI